MEGLDAGRGGEGREGGIERQRDISACVTGLTTGDIPVILRASEASPSQCTTYSERHTTHHHRRTFSHTHAIHVHVYLYRCLCDGLVCVLM